MLKKFTSQDLISKNIELCPIITILHPEKLIQFWNGVVMEAQILEISKMEEKLEVPTPMSDSDQLICPITCIITALHV